MHYHACQKLGSFRSLSESGSRKNMASREKEHNRKAGKGSIYKAQQSATAKLFLFLLCVLCV